ncbi:hypothetical protein H4R24_000787 [Coemansia sp. RSA 988]|nr:hypothetical protein H4R24_000787 [Coemansia sp. RSA 988]
MSIELMEGSDPSNLNSVTTIAENVPANSLQAFWSVPKNLKNGGNYAIRVVDENGEDFYGQFFKLSGNKGNASDTNKVTDTNKMVAKGTKESQGVKPTSAESNKHADTRAHDDQSDVAGPKKTATPMKGAAVESSTTNAKPMRKESEASNGAISLASGSATVVLAACVGALGAAAF